MLRTVVMCSSAVTSVRFTGSCESGSFSSSCALRVVTGVVMAASTSTPLPITPITAVGVRNWKLPPGLVTGFTVARTLPYSRSMDDCCDAASCFTTRNSLFAPTVRSDPSSRSTRIRPCSLVRRKSFQATGSATLASAVAFS